MCGGAEACEMANEINGSLLVLDGSTTDPECFNEANLQAWMLETAKALEMDIILGPVFKDVELDPSKLTGDVFQDEGGISGFCMISTSHISIHCWPLRKHFLADVFSCRPFDTMAAIAVARRFLSVDLLRPLSIGRFPPRKRRAVAEADPLLSGEMALLPHSPAGASGT